MGDDRLGSSWKLSGGSAWSSGPTNGLEEPPGPAGDQAEGADVGGRELLRPADSAGGWLTHRATTGDSSHSTTNGAAIQAALGFEDERRAPRRQPRSPTPPAICR